MESLCEKMSVKQFSQHIYIYGDSGTLHEQPCGVEYMQAQKTACACYIRVEARLTIQALCG